MNDQDVESSVHHPEAAGSSPSGEVYDQRTSQPEPAAAPNQAQIPLELSDLISREIERRFQSAKDRRWAELEKQYRRTQAEADLSPPHPAAGITPDLSEEFAGKLMARAEEMLKRLGLRSTPEAAAILSDKDNLNGPGGTLELVDRVLEFALRDIQQGTGEPPTPAGVISPGGGTAESDDLSARYQRRKQTIRPGDINALTALKREFREKGLNIF